MLSKYENIFAWLVFFSKIVLWSDSQYLDILCDSEPEGDVCEYTEGDIAWFHAEVEPEGEYRTALIWTEGGQYAALAEPISNVDDATPVLDYGPIVLADYYYLDYIPIELVDDCDTENDELFYTLSRTEPTGRGENGEADVGVGVIIHDNDDNFYIENEMYDVHETTREVEFRVCRNGQKTAARTLEYHTTDLTAVSTGSHPDFVPPRGGTGTIDFDIGVECERSSIEIISDLDSEEETELFEISIVYNDPSVSGCTGKVVNPSTAQVTIYDSDSTLFWLQHSYYSVTEPASGTALFTFIVERGGNVASTSSIEFFTRAVSASSGRDYENPQSLTVNFDPNSQTAEGSITIRSDTSDEDPETFELTIQNPDSGIVREPHKALVTIHDAATTKSCVSFDSSVAVVFESAGEVTLILRRKGNEDNVEQIAVETEDVDASSSTSSNLQDFTAISEIVEFQIGDQEKSVTIPINDDNHQEDTEYFKVKLLQPSPSVDNALDICSYECQVVIKDDDEEFYLEDTSFRVPETAGSIEIYVVRKGFLGKSSTARVGIYAGGQNTATSRSNSASLWDFDLPSTVSFGVNEKFSKLTIPIRTGDGFEGEEEFTVELQTSSTNPIVYSGQIGVPFKATVIIYDTPICNPECVNGECVDDNVCECPHSFTGALCETAVKTFGASFAIVERPPGTPFEFSDDLYNSSSTRYVELKRDIELELFEAYNSIPGFLFVSVNGFYQGSVGVTYEVGFAPEASSNQGDVLETFAEIVDDAVLGNSDLKLSPFDIVCPVNFCHNGGQCVTTDTSHYCVCPVGFQGAQCSIQITVGGTDNVEEEQNDSGDSSNAAVIGIIIAGVLAILLLIFLALIGFMFLQRRRRRPKQQPRLRPPIEQLELRPYVGINPVFAGENGVVRIPPLY